MKKSTVASLFICAIASTFPFPLGAAAEAQFAPNAPATSTPAASTPTIPPAPLASPLAHATAANSHNWAGYVEEGADFTSVSGEWVVPSVAPTQSQSGDATWLGIGGMQSADLIQAGTRALTGPYGVSYQAWYEVLPAAGTPIALPVAAGDRIRASITETAPETWQITIVDLTSGAQFSQSVSYRSSADSAEWIEEAPQAAGALIPLDTFSRVAFSNITASGKPSVATRLSLVSSAGVPLASASSLSLSAFAVTRD